MYFVFCQECGVVFKTLTDELHKELAAQVYSGISWGDDRAKSIADHGIRLRGIVSLTQQHKPLKKSDHILDIGAGIGVLEHVLIEAMQDPAIKVTCIEPVPELARLLQSEYPQFDIRNIDFERMPIKGELFDCVFCLGVDYLFRDNEAALYKIARIAKHRAIFSRGVFLDMPCYWGGKPIRAFEDLVAPNPLITTYMYPDQYLELISRYFKIEAGCTAYEKFTSDSYVSTLPMLHIDASPLPAPATPNVIKNSNRAFSRLNELGVSIDG